MRYFEFVTEEKYDGLDNFVTMLKNLKGRYTSKGQPAQMNWQAISQIAKKTRFEVLGDPKNGYETFKSLWDTDPKAKSLLEPIVKNFNQQGIELNIPGIEAEPTTATAAEPQDSQQAVDKMAASAAPKQLAAQA